MRKPCRPALTAPFFILRDPVHEAADRVKHRAPDEHRRSDGEVEVLDVALVPKANTRSNASAAVIRRGSNQNVDSPANEIRQPQFSEAFLEPTLIRPTIAVDERDRLAPRSPHARIAGGPGAPLGDLDDPAARPTMTHGVEPARTALSAR